ncbi:MAG: cytochrome P450 [Sphingomonas sp.]|nr:cytochrome P450 [Sphingomonas sp.]MDX3884672.1 cytochrome P450 [Sphingomonas sp.]
MTDAKGDSASAICERFYQYAREHSGQNLDIEVSGVSVLLIQRHEEADQVLRRHADRYRKNMAWFRLTLGSSRFSEDGEAWRVRHALTHSHFTRFDRDRTIRVARECATRAIERMMAASAAGATTIDDRILREMTVSVVVENFLDIPMADLDLDLDAIATLMEYGAIYSLVPAGKTEAQYQETLRLLPAVRRRIIKNLRVFRDGRIAASPMLAGMLAADADPATGVVLEHELMTLFAAAAEAATATMGWICYLLARYPHIQEDLRRAALANDDEPIADFISEALRLYPPSPILGRIAAMPDTVDGRQVEPGQNVMISLIGVGHDRRLRADPWALDLGPAARRSRDSGVVTGFSTGPRVCGGKQFALTELIAFVSTYLTRARFLLTSTEQPRFRWKAQLVRHGGQPVQAVPLQR